jgi:hypothetical protein
MRRLLFAFLLSAALSVQNAAAHDAGVPEPAGAAERPVYIGRTFEAGGFMLLSETLKQQKIPFTEQPLLAGYGSFGTSIVVELPQAPSPQTAARGRFILAVPILSPEFKETGRAGGLSFAHQTALAFIEKMNSALAADSGNFDAAVFFLADDWTADDSAAGRAGYSAWLDMLDGGENDVIVYMDCAAMPDRIGVYAARGKGRTPYVYTNLITETLGGFGIKMFFNSGSRRISTLRERILHDEFDNNTPVLFLRGNASSNRQQAGNAPYHQAADFAAALCRYAQKALFLRQNAAVGTDDTNYAAFTIAQKHFVIREKSVIILFLYIFSAYIYVFYMLNKYTKKKKPKILYKILLAAAVLFFAAAVFAGPSESAGKKAAGKTSLAAVPEVETLFADISSAPFLEREFFTITIASSKEPLRFGLTFETAVLDASLPLPFVYESLVPEQWDGNTVQFALGNYPPNPLVLNLSLPKGMYGTFKINAYGINGSYAETVRSFQP